MLTGVHDVSEYFARAETVRDEIAVVVPVYMGKAMLHELCDRLVATLEQITDQFSIILVDDSSPDNSWPVILEIGRKDPRIRGLLLSRNFGQHYAITAGLDQARARWYIVMDCDLQDAPEDIPLLYAQVRQGFDIVVGTRRKEGHGLVKRQTSRLFYLTFNFLAGIDLDWGIGNYRIFSDRVAVGFRQMREQMRFFPASLSYMGFNVGTVVLPHHPRQEGRSSYTPYKLIALAANTILAHSQMPLKIVAGFGLCLSLLAMALAGLVAARAAIWGVSVTGWASLIVAIFAIGGVQIFITGIVGIYVGKSFEEAKKRPLYFIKDDLNLRE
jgi:glycosyltransferase involved in cell wall biosynthesis